MADYVVNGMTYTQGPDGHYYPQGGAAPSGLERPAMSYQPFMTTKVDPKAPYELSTSVADAQIKNITAQYAAEKAKQDAAKSAAETQSATLKAAQDKETYDAAHPQQGSPLAMTGPQFMAYMQQTNPGRAAYLKAIVEGRQSLTPQMARNPAGQLTLQQVSQIDPTFDATNYNARAANRKNAVSGKLSQSDNSLATALTHVSELTKLAPDVWGTSVRPFNALANEVQGALMGGKQPRYEQTAGYVGDEGAAAYGAGTAGERASKEGAFSENLSTGQKMDNARQFVKLALEKLAANRAQFNYGNGGADGPAKPDFMLLPPNTRKAIIEMAPKDAAVYFSNVPVDKAGPGTLYGGSAGSGGDGTPPSGTPPTINPGGPAQIVATGATRNQSDPTTSQHLDAMIRQGKSPQQINDYLTGLNKGYAPYDENKLQEAIDFAKTPAGQNYKGSYAQATVEQPNSMLNRAMASPLATAVTQAANATSMGTLDELGGAAKSLVDGTPLSQSIDEANAAKQAQAQLNPKSALAGNILGGAAAMMGGGALLKGAAQGSALGRSALQWAAEHPFLATTGGDMGYGGAYGAGEGNGNRLDAAGIGAVAGAGGSLLGQGAAMAGGKLLTGVVNPAVDALRARGIPLTVGEVLGGGFKKAQDAAMSMPVVGDMIARRYADGRRAFNSQAFQDAGAITGNPVTAVGGDGLAQLRAIKDNAYTAALDPVSINLNTPSFLKNMGATLQQAKNLPTTDDAQGHALSALNNYVVNSVDDNGMMTGNAFQQAYQGLSREAKPAPKAFNYDVGQTLQQGKNDLVGALQEQNPGAFDQFVAANNTNRHLGVLTDALQRAQNQIGDEGEPLFTPAQLSAAGTKNENTYGSRVNAAIRNKPFGDLSANAQQVMSSRLPDSGTTSRILVNKILLGGGATGLLGGAGYVGGGGTGAGEAVGLGTLGMGLLGTRMGQAALTGMLLKRPDLIRDAGQSIIDNSNVAGTLGTSYAVPQSLLGLSGR